LEIEGKVRRMLKLDEDLADFYRQAAGHPTLGAIVEGGRGRLLRSPTFFEDVVKTICTTNITWSQTKAMVARLVETLGAPYSGNPELRAFPTAQQIADADPAWFNKSIRLGYRNQYVQELAHKIADGGFQLEALDDRAIDPVALRKAIKEIKGVGDYAANTLMMIVGHYGHLAIDSEFRAHVTTRYFAAAESVSDREMAAIYEEWGDWQYLAYWFDHDE
jgi:3-methyladenine DNA glycosylase/8-oxoguanine DNA glycosylase